MKCCGENVVTPFCPTCGKAIGGPGGELLAHVRVQVKALRNKIAKYRKGKTSVWDEQLEKWSRWEAWLVEQMSRGDDD